MIREPRLSEAKRRLLDLQRRGGRIQGAAPSIDPKRHPRENPAPLSLAQEQVWRLDQTAGKLAPLHNESITIHRHGSCDPILLEASLREIIQRHEIFRTTYETQVGWPVQRVHDSPVNFQLPVDDLRGLRTGEREGRALELATQDARMPFDLQHGPLFRARLITLDELEHRIYLTAHQSIVDGITVFELFPFELTTAYESRAAGKPSPLPPLEAQYADFACWQRRVLTAEAIEKQLAYWENRLRGKLPFLNWPRPGQRPPGQTYRGALQPFTFDEEMTASLRELARREGTTLFTAVLGGLLTLLQNYTHQEDIIIGTLAPAGRKYAEFRRTMGYFLNPVALRADLSGNPPFSSLLGQLRQTTIEAISNCDVPLAMIGERLQLPPDATRSPFFTVALSIAPDVAELPPGWSMTYMDVESGGARWDLYLEFSERANGMMGRAQYNPDLFTRVEINRMLGEFRLWLTEILRKNH